MSSSVVRLVASPVPPECLSSDGSPLVSPSLSWDSEPLPASPCSLVLGSYSPEAAAERAYLRVTASYGLGLLLLTSFAGLVLNWRRRN